MRDGAPPRDLPTNELLARLDAGETCTLDELAEAATELLAGTTVSDRRVGDGIDGRTIRYFTTNGLLPRPFVGSDRRARYGRDHLVRVLAIRRLQAGGATLADAHRHLAGVESDELDQLAGLAGSTGQADATRPPTAAVARPFWATRPDPGPTPPTGAVVVLAPGVRLVTDHPLDVPLTHVHAAAAPLVALLTSKEPPR